MFTRHHLRSLSLTLLILAGCAGLTAFGATRRSDATPNPVANAQRATAVPTLQLQRPEDNACATGVVTFSWLWQGTPLVANQGFEVRLWKVGQRQHVSLATPASRNAQRVDLRLTPVVRQGGTGRYLWSVAVVQLSPYRQIGKETSPRRLYIDLTKPANAPCIVPGSPTNTPGVSYDISATAPSVEPPVAWPPDVLPVEPPVAWPPGVLPNQGGWEEATDTPANIP